MTGILENPPGVGHNVEGAEKENQHWERWAKKRTFVRALEGTYSHLTKQLVDQPRVYSSKDVPWKGGPGHSASMAITPRPPRSRNRSKRISRPMRRARPARSTAISTAPCSTC